MDKQNYVTKKIKKIIRYINGIELALELDNDKKLDSDNLITLCSYHHKQAEMNKISKEESSNLIDIPPDGR